MNTVTREKFKRALFVLENKGDLPLTALNQALEYCRYYDIELNVICVLPSLKPLHYSNSTSMLQQLEEASISSSNNRLKADLAALCPSFTGQLSVIIGKQFIEVIKVIVKDKYDLLIKQTQNSTWLDSVFGSNDLHFLRKCPSAIWLIHKNAPQQYQNVGLAIDFSDDKVEQALNNSLIQRAYSFSQQQSAHLRIISAYDAGLANFASQWANDSVKFEQDFLRQEAGRRHFESDYLIKHLTSDTKLPFTISKHVVEGHPQSVIPRQIASLKIDLLVMGTVGRAGLMGMLIGNTAESILLQIDCSLFSEKPQGFVCPISVN